MSGINNTRIIGVSRVRNEEYLVKDVLDHLSNYIDGVIIYDDASEDNTLQILKNHPLVIDVIENKNWEEDRIRRSKEEGNHRQLLFDIAKNHNADWIYVFDADEFIEFKENIDFLSNDYDAYFFRLYDYYITENDVNKGYKERLYLGPEYRDIPMLFRADLDLKFHARVPRGFKTVDFGGFVKHYGKAKTIEEWNKKCEYYINHLAESQPGNIDISDKWRERLGKAVHSKSDFHNPLIKWEDKIEFGIELAAGLEQLSTLNLNILVATNRLETIGGSETFTYTLIEELRKYPKFNVEYFTFNKGLVSDKIESDLNIQFMSLNKYDLILANHNTTVDFLHKKGIIIQTCHGIYPELEQPNKKANGFVSISKEVQNHLAHRGFSSVLVYNSINLNRFYNKEPLNKKLNTILSLCHSKRANNVIKKLSEDLGVNYLQAYKYENPVWDIESVINQADLVFGLGRSAYEAMSCGRPVVVFDDREYFPSYGDGYVKDNLGFSLQNNCSGRYSKKRFTLNDLKAEVNKYNFNDQFFFRDFAKKELDIRKNVVKYIEYFVILRDNEINNRPFNRIKNYIKKLRNTFFTILKKFKKRIS